MEYKGRTVRFEDDQGQQHFWPVGEKTHGARGKGEARPAACEGPQASPAPTRTDPETQYLMEQVVRRDNLQEALKRVRANKGSPGVDGMTVEELVAYLREHWLQLREELLAGAYQPSPVKRVEIPKPGGGVRLLGVPTVLDRFIQQAILQVFNPIFDPTFSEHSYGFRPGRRAHQAVKQAQKYIREGYEWVVDMDLEKFFDRVNHDVLMGRLAKKIGDKRLLRLVRRYLQAGVMVHGVAIERMEGTPQGGPLSPLLSNVLLDELDKELERRGHRFCRYADDCNVYVQSERAGQRVMASIRKFLEKRLRLKVNEEKSAVAKVGQRQFLGFSISSGERNAIRIASKTRKRFKEQIRRRTRRSRGCSLETLIANLNRFLTGWIGYFRLCETPGTLQLLDKWIRRRLRCFRIKQWKRRFRTRYAGLRSQGVGHRSAGAFAGSRRGWWKLSGTPQAHEAFPARFFAELRLVSLFGRYQTLQAS